MRETLFKTANEITTGINPDLDGAPTQAPLWVDGRNVVFEDGQIRPQIGQFIYASLPAGCVGLPGTGIIEIIQDNAKALFWGTPSRSDDSCQGRLIRWESPDLSATNVSRDAAIHDTIFSGSGINDIVVTGTTTADIEQYYEVKIQSGPATNPDKFIWRVTTSGIPSSWSSPIELVEVGSTVALGSDGVLVAWAVNDGHTVDDVWTIPTNPSGYTGTGVWSLAVWGEQIVATNGVDRPQIYGYTGATTKFQDLYNVAGGSGLLHTDKAQVFETMGPFVFMFNLDTNNQALRWGDEDSATVWNPLAANFAGDLVIRGLNSEIKAVSKLGSVLSVYGEDQAHGVAFIGGQLVHSQRNLVASIGAVSSHAVSSVGTLNYGMSHRGFWQTNGSTAAYIDQDRIHDFVYQNLNLDALDQVTSWVNPTASTVYWSIPVNGSTKNNLTVSFNFLYNSWSILEYGIASATSGVVFPSTHYVSTDGSPLEESPEASGLAFGIPIPLVPTCTITAGYATLPWGPMGGTYGTGEIIIDG